MQLLRHLDPSNVLFDQSDRRYADSAADSKHHSRPSLLTLTFLFSRWCRYLTTTFALAACIEGTSALAIDCKVASAHAPSEAESAFLRSDYDRAATLYQAQLQSNPADPTLTAGLATVLLRQQKMTEAEDIVQKALSHNPNSAILLTSLGEVHYREGMPWLAADDVNAAMKIDPCYPQLRLLYAEALRLNSMYASAAKELTTAHALDPHDPQIRRRWLDTLPIKERITELETYLATGGGDDAETIKNLQFYLEYLKQRVATPRKACRLVSDTSTATIPFAAIMHDSSHISSFGLDVKFNDRNARLQIDTGASGLVISRSVAERAGLQQFSHMEVGGIGSEGRKAGYIAVADDIKIGSLEFHNCEVRVIDQRNVADNDGLIGMDVFSRFLVTLDYPLRKLQLAPLPPRPDDTTSAQPTLETASNSAAEDSSASETKTPTPKAISRGPYDRYVAPEMKDWTRVYRIGHNLLVPASLNNSKPKMFVLDTGAFSTTVTPEVAREVTKVRSNNYMTVRGLNGKVDKVYSADSITFRFANISQKVEDVVAFATTTISKSLNMEVSGLIGYTALAQMTIGIDYRDGLVKFSYDPNRGYRFGQ
jgi:predicted aspartyl protease